MIGELLAALRAIPHIVDALNRLTDAATVMAASKRKEDKDELVKELIASARRRREQRVRDSEVQRVAGDNSETPGGA